MKLRSKNVLVTGGARRIGRAICELLAEYGANVAVHFRTSGDEAAALCRELEKKGVVACGLQADLSGEAEIRRLVERAHSRLGGLDVLVNNAAVFMADGVGTLQAARAMEHWRINLLAPLLLSRAFTQVAKGGGIINIIDQRVAHPDPLHLSYWLSKKALEDATRALALDLAPDFTVNGVSPGAVLPPERKPGHPPNEEPAGPMPGRPPAPLDVANAVVYLLNNDSITGEIIRVDGGQHLARESGDGR